jgi:hypothetical protein
VTSRAITSSVIGSSPLMALPSLDVEELLDDRVWERGALDESDRMLLDKAIQFLGKVLAGHAIVRDTATGGDITPDVVAIDAYQHTKEALSAPLVELAPDFERREQLARTTKEVLERILSNRAGEVPQSDFELAKKFFEALTVFSYAWRGGD